MLREEKSEGEGTVQQQVARKYKRQDVQQVNKKRHTSDGDKIAFDLEQFQYRDAGKQIPKGVVSAFLTTGKFEAKSETTEEAGMLQTYQRLEKFKSAAGMDADDFEDLWGSEERVKGLIIAGSRTPKAKRHPSTAAGVMPIVEDSTDIGDKKLGAVSSTITWHDFDEKPRTTKRNQLKQQVTAQHKKVSQLGGATTPSFLEDLQMEKMQKNPEPVKLGKRIGDAAARGPKSAHSNGHSGGLLENGPQDGDASAQANGRHSRLFLGWRKSRQPKPKDEEHDSEGLEVMV